MRTKDDGVSMTLDSSSQARKDRDVTELYDDSTVYKQCTSKRSLHTSTFQLSFVLCFLLHPKYNETLILWIEIITDAIAKCVEGAFVAEPWFVYYAQISVEPQDRIYCDGGH